MMLHIPDILDDHLMEMKIYNCMLDAFYGLISLLIYFFKFQNVTLEHEKGQGYDDYMGVSAGGITETPEEARDRRKKEKEADKKRKEEAEKKKKSKELSASEDKLDKVVSDRHTDNCGVFL